VDTLGAAQPTTVFGIPGSGGVSIFGRQFAGPRFVLTGPRVLTEIGGFINNPTARQFLVEVRPEKDGHPDPDVVLATFVLSQHNDPLFVGYEYEFASVSLSLPAGTYYALFRPPPDGDGGSGLSVASLPFQYQAGVTAVGVLDPVTGWSITSPQVHMAVRILAPTATPAPTKTPSDPGRGAG
jgi:hypothetical protein